MFKEMLQQFEEMKLAGENLEDFSSAVLGTIEKEAVLGAVARGIGGVGKSLFNAQMTFTKGMIKDPIGITMLAAPVLAGKQTATQGVIENTVPLYNQTKAFARDLKQSKQQSGIPANIFTPTKHLPYQKAAGNTRTSGLEKAALDFDSTSLDPMKEVINSVGVAAAAGAGTYLAHDSFTKAKETSNWAKGLSRGVDKAITGIGKGTAKAMTKNKPLSQTFVSTMGTAGKIADKLTPNQGVRLDFSTVDRKVPLYSRLPVFLGTAAGVSLLEEWLTSNTMDKVKELKNERASRSDRSNRSERSERSDRRFDGQRNNNYQRNRDNQPRYASLTEYLLEKHAANRDARRLISEQMIKPAVTTGISLTTLALLSRLVGHNLYGGMEKIRKDDEIGTKKVIIDVPSDEISGTKGSKKKIEAALSKQADLVTDLQFLNADSDTKNSPESSTKSKTQPTKMDKAKESLDKKIQKSKVLSKLDAVMDENKYRYTGKRGLAHFVVEEMPFKTVGALGYAAPMIGAGVLLERNLKRGLEPLEDEPGIPSVPEGMTRVVIMERPGGEKGVVGAEKKASVADGANKALALLKDRYMALHPDRDIRLLTAVNFATIPPTIVGLKEMIPGDKNNEEKKASTDNNPNNVVYMDPNRKINKQPFLENATTPISNSLAAQYRNWDRQELLKLLRKVKGK